MLRTAIGRLVESLTPKARRPPAPPPISTRTLIPQKPVTPALVSLAELNAPRLVENPRLVMDEAGTWRAEARMGQPCAQLRVCVDYAMAAPEEGSWTGRERVTLARLSDVAHGQSISVDVACPGKDGIGPWRWCTAEGEDSPIIGRAGRCRIAFVPDDGAEHSFYFVIATDEMGGAADGGHPILVGEHLFGYKDSWEAEAPLAFRPRWRGR